MLCAFSNATEQTINPGASVIFTVVEVPCTNNLVRTRLSSGNFLLSGNGGCPMRQTKNYFVDFGADIAANESAAEISVAISVDSIVVPASTMSVTPTATDAFFNVSKAVVVDIWRGCCETMTVTNTSTQPITMRNAIIVIRD